MKQQKSKSKKNKPRKLTSKQTVNDVDKEDRRRRCAIAIKEGRATLLWRFAKNILTLTL